MRHTLGGLGETQNRQDPSMVHISRTLPQSVNGKLTKQASKPKFQEARMKLKKLRLGLQRQLLKTGTALYLFIIKLHYSQNNWVNPFKRLLMNQRHLAVFRSCISATKCTKAFLPIFSQAAHPESSSGKSMLLGAERVPLLGSSGSA